MKFVFQNKHSNVFPLKTKSSNDTLMQDAIKVSFIILKV